MPDKPRYLGQFWQELKRRRVIHVITVYASAAFVIIELVTNLAEPFNLPAQMPIIVVVVLAIGFPLAVILSWLYDLTSEGIERTKPLSEIKEGVKPAVPNAWKIATYVSFVVIIGLVVLNVMGRSKQLRAGDIQRVLILPFANLTGTDSLEYFVEGMHSSLISEMQRIGKLQVINRITSNVYKNVDKPLHEIAQELNVDAVIEGDIMCLGDSICQGFRLISGSSDEELLWIGDYTEEISQILNYYKRVIRQIADEINIELTADEELLLAKSRTVDREAYDEYLKARLTDDLSRESLNKTLEYLNVAVEKEPDWAPLYTELAQVWLRIQHLGYEPPSVASPKIYENLNKALELDPDLSESHYLNAVIAQFMEWNWEKSEKEFLRVLAINPNDAGSRILYAQLLLTLQRPDEALMQGQLAFDLDPLSPRMKCHYGALLTGLGDCKTALALAEEVTATDPGHYLANNVIQFAALRCKEYDKVIKAERYLLPVFNVKEEDIKEIERIFNEQGIVKAYEKIIKHLEEFAEKNTTQFLEMAFRYIVANQPDKAMDWIEKGFEIHDPQMVYITSGMVNYDPLFKNPRFIAMVEKMNLSLPKPN
jgi:TolB-like protein